MCLKGDQKSTADKVAIQGLMDKDTQIISRSVCRLRYRKQLPCLSSLFTSALSSLISNSSREALLNMSTAEKMRPVMKMGFKDLKGTEIRNWVREVKGHLKVLSTTILAQQPTQIPMQKDSIISHSV